MNILILGDVMGSSGRKAIKKNLSKIINENEIDFTIINVRPRCRWRSRASTIARKSL